MIPSTGSTLSAWQRTPPFTTPPDAYIHAYIHKSLNGIAYVKYVVTYASYLYLLNHYYRYSIILLV